MSAFSPQIQSGVIHLRRVDPIIGQLMKQVGPFEIRLERDRFRSLVRSIIFQQISGRAAESIFNRLIATLGPDGLTPQRLAALTKEQFRAAGVSPQKSIYLQDLAGKVETRQVRLASLARLADERVIEQLTQVKGVGVWTAQMFLIFSLGRLDVFPYADLGVRMALRNLYGLKALPDREQAERIAASWRPFATLASWYCWRSLDLPASAGR